MVKGTRDESQMSVLGFSVEPVLTTPVLINDLGFDVVSVREGFLKCNFMYLNYVYTISTSVLFHKSRLVVNPLRLTDTKDFCSFRSKVSLSLFSFLTSVLYFLLRKSGTVCWRDRPGSRRSLYRYRNENPKCSGKTYN